jgi:mono/diheme cytochrome c family protein
MKRMLMIVVAIAGAALCVTQLGTTRAGAQELQPTANELPNKIWKRGLAIAPVTLNLAGKDKVLVGEGSYIVNVGCVDCHTSPAYAPGGNPFFGQPEKINTANYLAGGEVFGPFTSSNITPDQAGLPAGLTFAQFVEVMRTGKDFKNRHPQFGPVLQVMPWPAYAKLTDDDLQAIYEYLRAIPHAEPAQ